jgi:hypothetical protein
MEPLSRATSIRPVIWKTRPHLSRDGHELAGRRNRGVNRKSAIEIRNGESRQSDSNRRPADYKPRDESGVCHNFAGEYGVRRPFATLDIPQNLAIMAVFGSEIGVVHFEGLPPLKIC